MALRRLSRQFSESLWRNAEQLTSSIMPSSSGVVGLKSAGYQITNVVELGGVRHASFQEVKIRMKSVKNIQKITKAMKMVAASKLRKAQRVALASRGIQEPFTRFFGEQCAESAAKTVLVPVTSDRGLCGGINSNIVKFARGLSNMAKAAEYEGEGTKDQTVFVLGEKGRTQLQRTHRKKIEATMGDLQKSQLSFAQACAIAEELLNTEYDKAQVVYNRFMSAVSYKPTVATVMSPAALAANEPLAQKINQYELEGPDEPEFLQDLAEFQLACTLYAAMADNHASEHASRVQAMENSTKNAKEMLDGLTLLYNRTRQAVITKELIEIISGAEALNG